MICSTFFKSTKVWKYRLVQWSGFSDVTGCMQLGCIQWPQRANFTAPGCKYRTQVCDLTEWTKLFFSDFRRMWKVLDSIRLMLLSFSGKLRELTSSKAKAHNLRQSLMRRRTTTVSSRAGWGVFFFWGGGGVGWDYRHFSKLYFVFYFVSFFLFLTLSFSSQFVCSKVPWKRTGQSCPKRWDKKNSCAGGEGELKEDFLCWTILKFSFQCLCCFDALGFLSDKGKPWKVVPVKYQRKASKTQWPTYLKASYQCCRWEQSTVWSNFICLDWCHHKSVCALFICEGQEYIRTRVCNTTHWGLARRNSSNVTSEDPF